MTADTEAAATPRCDEAPLGTGFDALLECRHELEHCIAAEHRNPTRNTEVLVGLQREMGRLSGELRRYDGLLRTLSRGRARER